MIRASLLLMVVAACGHSSSTGSQIANVASTAAAAPHAFVADSTGLVEVADAHSSSVVAPGEVTWCNVDPRAQVVWMMRADGLSAYDLVDHRVHAVVAFATADIQVDTTIIDWGNEQLANSDKLHYQNALAVHMTPAPRVSSAIGCDGDMGVYCYGDSDPPKLVPSLAEKLKAIDALKLADPAYVAQLAKRGASRKLSAPTPKPRATPANPPKIDKAACTAMPENCGTLSSLPGGSLWLVVTADSRGDFYHQSRMLWDAASAQFLVIADGKLARSVAPPADTDADYSGMQIATTGALSAGGIVFDTTAVWFTPADGNGITCGWSTGSWGVPLFTQ